MVSTTGLHSLEHCEIQIGIKGWDVAWEPHFQQTLYMVVSCEGTTPTATTFKSKAYDDLDIAVKESKTLEKP